jgi:LAS superfamily LD-carboxypeptidase LdcB
MAPPVADPAVAPTPVGPTPGPTPTPNPTPTPTPPPTPPPPPQPAPPLTTVRGITVATSIAGQLDAMLGAAASAGITLGGSGYRDINRQIELRRAHCGTSYYAIYEMPAMLCTPPTAIPGLSMHEKGLAVDFTWNGRAITSRDSPAFQWLAANAGRYGFINLPSEPWHWSVSGR